MKMRPADVIAHQAHHGFARPAALVPAQPVIPLIFSSPERIDFFMDFEPPTVTAQHKGARVVVPNIGKPFIHWFVKKEIEAAEKMLAAQLAPFRPQRPFQGPLRLVAEWTFPWRSSEPKRNRGAGWRWKDTAPDAGNSNKLLEDVMQREGFFLNDSQIADPRYPKMWGDRPGIRITLESLQQP